MRKQSGRSPCCEKVGLNKGSWTPAEDLRLVAYVRQFGHTNWRALPKLAGLSRCGKSCRLRWINYLRPDIKRGNFTKEEEDTIIRLHDLLGNKWSKIASALPGRTDNEIKNVWNTHLKKRLAHALKTTPNINASFFSASRASTPCSSNTNVSGESSTSSNSPPDFVAQKTSVICGIDDYNDTNMWTFLDEPIDSDVFKRDGWDLEETAFVEMDPELLKILQEDNEQGLSFMNSIGNEQGLTNVHRVDDHKVEHHEVGRWLEELKKELGFFDTDI